MSDQWCVIVSPSIERILSYGKDMRASIETLWGILYDREKKYSEQLAQHLAIPTRPHSTPFVFHDSDIIT